MPELTAYVVTRTPTAPPRRAGVGWPVGDTSAWLSEAQAAAIAADPRYRIAPAAVEAAAAPVPCVVLAKDGPIPTVAESKSPAGNLAGRGKARRKRVAAGGAA